MDIIQLLPDSVANQIAAGEVIQRPASVIKELVENAVDAGAKTIKVLVVDAGRTSIQVIDDGCGMSDTDARLSFGRHATSKIRCADDLFALRTMGFRGEALASIAAVAQVTLQTRQKSDELGTRICISGSQVTSQEPVVCPEGSNFLVENLFYNVPVRRKFLKSNSTEMSHITEAFERIVLVYPEINFLLYNNGQEVMNLRAGSTHQRIISVFGKRINQSLLPVETNTTLCKIRGFVGKPESSRQKGAEQFFFVNGRYMDHPYFRKAVMMAYDRLIPAGDKVHYFIYFEINPEDIDVNIHPVKTQIKFENEQAIWQILLAAVRDAIGKFSGVTELEFDTEGKPEIPVYNPNALTSIKAPSIDVDPTYNPFAEVPSEDNVYSGENKKSPVLTAESGAFSPQYLPSGKGHHKITASSSLGISGKTNTQRTQDWQSLYAGIVERGREESRMQPRQSEMFSSVFNESKERTMDFAERSHVHYQYRGSYIMTEVSDGMLFVDQHRADIRILYEEYMHTLATRSSHVQKLLFPEVVQFPPSYGPMLDTILEEMCGLGFEITNIGGGSYSVSGIPAGLSGLDAVTLVSELVSASVEYGSDVADEINSNLALELAQRAATPYGEILSQEDMESMIEKLLNCKSYRYTPDGKTVMYLMPNSDLESHF